MTNQIPTAFWSISTDEMIQKLQTTPKGLSNTEAKKRLEHYGANLLKTRKQSNILILFLSQFKNPIILILLLATILSFFLHDPADALIILTIVFISGLLGFLQERGATNAIEELLSIVQVKMTVLRDETSQEVPMEEIVPGDIVILESGNIIPGDGLIQESKDLFIDEATLTGETFPVEKEAAVLPKDIPLNQRTNALWMGTHVVNGNGKALIVRTGKKTEFGQVFQRLERKPQETEFEHGIKKFGYFLMQITFTLVSVIFAFNIFLKRPILDSFLFSLALAVGLIPQLLPAIMSINLSRGAKQMARQKVIVKKLSAIENFGSMNVICADKTGTITKGIVRLQSAVDIKGNQDDQVHLYAYLNSFYESGFTSPIDEAIRNERKFDLASYKKLDEIEYDFQRKRLSILVAHEHKNLMITKGALDNVLTICSKAKIEEEKTVDIEKIKGQIQERFQEFSGKGFRTLGVAFKETESEHIKKEDESGMVFIGFLLFFDPPKSNINKTLMCLEHLGVTLKVITGDNHLVATNISQQIGLTKEKIITGYELDHLSDEELIKQVAVVDVFAEIEPNQKERIIIALKKAGNVVGYIGDGINDASALHVADVGISVDTAVDVAKDAADIVLLKKGLNVLVRGIRQGRITFANTLKYVYMATSANFGNMFSMAGISLFLPFLPMLPKQILLTNLLTDLPEMTISTDRVDMEMVNYPRRWNIRFIRKFMLTFGLVSSFFDYVTFGALLLILHAQQEQFRTGWFLESVISASFIVLVIRTQKSIFKSKPGKYLFAATLFVAALTLILPFTPLKGILGFTRPSFTLLLLIGVIVFFYSITAEVVKKVFYKKINDP